ncbi:5' nucleotidase, NT5C type [Priestia aryabhattai]
MKKKIIFEDEKDFMLKKLLKKFKRKPIILLDMDDTIAEFAQPFWTLHNKLFKDFVDYLKVNGWNFDEFSKRGKDAYTLFKYPGLFRNLPPKPYAKEFIEDLREIAEVVIVSDSPSGTSYLETVSLDIDPEHTIDFPHSNPTDDKRMWLEEHFNFDKDDIVFCSKKDRVIGDILIDDKPATYNSFVEANRKIILLDAPHNRDIDTKWRAKDLNHAKKLVYRMLEEMIKEEAS